MTSVDSGRTMEEIASGASKVWHSNRAASAGKRSRTTQPNPVVKVSAKPARRASPVMDLEPMYASVGSDIPHEGWTFEPKYDGVRVLAFTTESEVQLITRNGKDKSAQFPEIVDDLKSLARKKTCVCSRR